MDYKFSEVKKVMKYFSNVTDKKARLELEQMANKLFVEKDMKAGEIIEIFNKVLRAAYLNAGVEK